MAAEEFNPNDPLGSFGDTWKRVILEPQAFFDALPPAGGIQPPLIFAAASLFIGGVGVLLFGGGLKGLFGLLVLGLIRLFVGAAIIVLVAQNLFDGRGDYEATFRALGYSSAVAVGFGLPFVKYFAGLYGAYLVILGLARAHSLDNVRAVLILHLAMVVALVTFYALDLLPTLQAMSPLAG